MSFIKEFWRTLAIIAALFIILAAVVITPEKSPDEIVPMLDNVEGYLDIPADGQCYLSAGFMYTEGVQSVSKDMGRQIDDFSAMVGKNQTMFIDAWGDFWERDEAFWQLEKYKSLTAQGTVKAIGVNLWPCLRSDHANDNYTVVQIANGEQDDFIKEQAEKVKTFQYPVFIRFGAEFNIYQGAKFEGQTPDQTYIFADDPTNFIKAWQHYVTVFRMQNVSNAIFLWNPNFADFGSHHYTEYYPGDEYVDWVGVDIYQYEPTSDPASMLRGVYDEYSDQKPIAVPEWGTNWLNQDFADSDRARFIERFFDAVESMPQIKMVNYWYYHDFKFTEAENPLTVAAYERRVSNPRYIGS